jgi:hypothetical protein
MFNTPTGGSLIDGTHFQLQLYNLSWKLCLLSGIIVLTMIVLDSSFNHPSLKKVTMF